MQSAHPVVHSKFLKPVGSKPGQKEARVSQRADLPGLSPSKELTTYFQTDKCSLLFAIFILSFSTWFKFFDTARRNP